MDTSIRNLLISAQKHTGTERNPTLVQAYGLLRNVAETRPAVDAPEPFNSDLYVLCAEIAFQNGCPDMAKECLKMFFMKPPPANQFLCRAYLCQAQLLAPPDANSPEKLEKAVVYLLKAISFAKKNQRYHFLVYNASVLYWQFCRPFLKPNFRQYLARSLHQVVKALDDIDDKDYEWRAQLMIALIECHLDAGRRSDASHIAAATVTFIKQNVSSLYKQVFGLMVRHQLVESTKFHKDVKNSPELSIFYKICKIKVSLEQGEQKEYYSEIQSVLNQMGVSHMPTGRVTRYDTKGAAGRPRSPSISPTGKEEDVPRDRKSPGKGGRRTPTPTTSKKLAVDSVDKPYLLLELGRLCLDLGFADLADACAEHTKTCIVKEQGFYLELEFLQCELMVKALGEKQESYHKSAVEVRQQAIKRCEEAIMNAVRQGDPNVLQAGCVTQWNLCMPLLQPNLRQTVRKPLTLVAEALEDISSLLIQLRCQVHTELAKCEEDREQIQVAMDHLRKALSLDDGGVYRERLEVSLHRLELRSELYKTPERPEDQAAMIIEQARTADSGTIRMKRSLLVKAGEALAPDAFLLVLDSESDTKDIAGGKGPLTVIRQLSGKARQFTKCTKKAEGHLKRLGNENERERAALWADLAKTARKQEVWDVCRVAARFCLLYDDARWKNSPPVKMDSPKLERSRTAERDSKEEIPLAEKSSSRIGSRPATPVAKVALYDKDLIRILAEVNFIQGEAMIHLLRGEGVQLNNKPIPPEDKSKHPKGYIPKKPEDDPEWIEYCDWINSLSESATDSFLRGLTLGCELEEPWLVCSGAAYIWNYNNHMFTADRHREVITTLTSVLDALKAVGHAGETVMLVNICHGLATGLMKPWMPDPPPRDSLEASPSPSPGDKSPTKSKGKGGAGGTKSKTPYSASVSPDAMPDLKKAIEVCEYAIQVTNGDTNQDVVPIYVRLPLLQTWVFAKQMALVQINKNLGTDDDHNTEGQRPMTRAIVATEMLCLNNNGIMEFKETPFIGDIVQMVEDCGWSEKFVELQIWCRLTYQSFLAKQHALVVRCSKQTLKFANTGTAAKGKKVEAHRYIVEQEMLSYASALLGQSLIENMGGKNALRREAMEAFLNSARFARNSTNYELVMIAGRHYWNACLPLVSQPIERELLKEPIRVILQCITATTEKTVKKEEDEVKNESPSKAAEVKGEEVKQVAEVKDAKESKSGMIGGPEEDLTLRAALYGVLFQSYADKGEWELALQAMDQAVNDMPRTRHRLLIFKHRVMVKAKLGRPVHMDIQKFKDESEDYVAHMWRRVALSSKQSTEQMSSYQYAIEALNSADNEWQKVDYLLEFGQWLYANDFPLADAVDQIEWAIDILLNMKDRAAEGKKKEEKPAKESRKGQMKAKREKKTKPGKSSARPRGGSTGRKSPEGGKKTPETMSKASDARSDVSDSESEINIGDYIPVVKQADIGVLPANPALAMSDLTDISQLDALIRAHMILAQLHGRNSQAYTDICLMAHSYLMQLWKVCMSSAGPVMKEIAKNPHPDPSTTGKKSANAKKDKKDKEPSPKEKPKRKGPLDALPSSTEEWAVYDVPDEVLEAFRHADMVKTGINAENMKKPMLTLHYLDSLVETLQQIGYTHLTLPVLAFQDLISRGLLLNNALHVLVHVRSIEVCQSLDLKAGVGFHEKTISPIIINEEDQASSREEIAMMKEKQMQVAREEMRVKATLAQLSEETSVKKHAQTPCTPGFQSVAKDEIIESESHLGKILGAVTFRELWTETAHSLIRQGSYMRGREFLSEALSAAREFEDSPLEARILYLLGKLSYEEAQYGQAINLCRMAQELYQGDEVFWHETTVLIVESTLHDYSNRKAKRTARKILIQTLNEFTRLYEERPNRMGVLGFVLADLEGRLASVQADILLTEHKNVNNPQIMRGILSACEKFENATENLIRLNYQREALSLMKKHAAVLLHLAREAIEKDITHMYYLQSALVLKEAATLAEDLYQDSLTLHGLQETRNLSLPVQRELVDVQILVGETLTEILHVQAKEARIQQLEDQRKGSVVKMVEDLIRQTPTYTHMEKEWEESKQNCGEEAISLLLSAHSLSGSITRLRARALSGLGRCLCILSQHSGPDPPPHWMVQEMELLKLNVAGGEDEEGEDGEGENNLPEDRQHHKYAQQIKNIKHQHGTSKYYLTLATECLTQCLNLALANKFTDLAGRASLDLVDCFGQFDAGSASNFLALHQSCAASQALMTTLCRSQLDPSDSRLAALLKQRENLLRDDISTNLASSPLMMSVETTLEQDWQAWKRIEVMPNHLELLKEFPPNFNFVVLQHSPDKTFLYGALLDKLGKPAAGGGRPNPKQLAAAKAAAASAPSKAKVFGTETNPRQLEDLIGRFRRHKQSVQQMLLKQEYQRTQAALRTRMLENLDDSMKDLETRPQTEGEAESEVERLQEEFRQLVSDMDDYLKPIMAPIETAFRNSQTPVSSVNVGKDAKMAEPVPSQECVVVLADLDLLEMPLEALDCLKDDNILSLSRDFSLQVFYHRFHQEQPVAEESGGDKKKKKVDSSAAVSRIPGVREAKQKQAKIIPLDRKPEPWQQAVDTMNFRYIVDPQKDCPETEEQKPLDQFNQVLETYEQQFTPRWLGVTGEEHTPSVGEWEIYITESSSFVFYGMEKLLSYLPPAKISALNIPDCLLVYALDMAQTSKSFLRQSKVDVLKSHNTLALEKPVETAMLVTLSGVKCLMSNQWHCTLSENSNKLHLSMKDMLEKGKTTGEAVRLLFSPKKRKQEEEKLAAEQERVAESVTTEKDKGGDTNRSKDTDSLKGGKKPSGAGDSRPESKEERMDGEEDPDKDKEEPKDLEEDLMKRDSFNMVCYGLPNLIITQV